MTPNEWLIISAVGIPLAFVIGRYSTKVTFFHAKAERKLSVPEFMKSRQ